MTVTGRATALPGTQTECRLAYRQSEVARLLGVSAQSVSEWIRDNEIKAIRVGRIVLIPVSEIDRLLGDREA